MAHDHAEHGHSHSHGMGHVHGSADKKRVLIATCLTAGFMVAEALGGWLTGSLALVADAGHMLADAIALGLAWYAFHLAGRPATGRLTYGFARVKTLVAYTNGIAIFVIALWIVYEACGRLMTPSPVLGGPMLVVAVAGLLVNIASFVVLHGGDRESLNMRGAILHVMGDLLGSAAAIVAAIVIIATGWTPIDPILSVLVSLLILSTAWSLMREAAHVLLEGVPASLDRDLVAKDIENAVKGVREVHHMHVWSLDGTSNMATLHACLNDGVDPHVVVSAIKKRLAVQHGIEHATVEPEFGQCADNHDEHDHHHDHDDAHDAPRDRRHYHRSRHDVEAEQPRSEERLLMDRDTRNAAIAAALILLLFGLFAYFLPTIMLAAGKVSTVLAIVVAVVFMVGLFVVLWLRGRSQRKKGL